MTLGFTRLFSKIQSSPNHISPSVYDTAWLAWLYPEALDWLLEAQHPDGSWGAELEYYHDRVIATLSALNAIAATSTNGYALNKIERGVRYLEKAIPLLSEDVFETISFELLLPSMVEIGQGLGLDYDRVAQLIEPQKPLYYQKLALIPKDLIYCPHIMLPHSIEFMGFERLDHQAATQVRSKNGGIHHSPAATAFVEVATGGSPAGQNYLRHLLKEYNGAAPSMYPFETFEIVWSLYPLYLYQELTGYGPDILPLVKTLKTAWTEKGVGLSRNFIVDPDDTAIGFLILNQFGLNPDPGVFEHFEEKDHFRCYAFERNISLDIHIHIIEALKTMPDGYWRKQELLSKALQVLKHYLSHEYLVDKWHVSPYYTTAHTIISLTGLADKMLDKQINWLLKTQRPNGRWTYYPNYPLAAIEETAHALLALMTVYEKRGDISFKVIERGYHFLQTHYRTVEELPALWINKNLYNPYYIVEATILAALAKYQTLRPKAIVSYSVGKSLGTRPLIYAG